MDRDRGDWPVAGASAQGVVVCTADARRPAPCSVSCSLRSENPSSASSSLQGPAGRSCPLSGPQFLHTSRQESRARRMFPEDAVCPDTLSFAPKPWDPCGSRACLGGVLSKPPSLLPNPASMSLTNHLGSRISSNTKANFLCLATVIRRDQTGSRNKHSPPEGECG